MYFTSYTEDFIKAFYTKIDILEPQELQFQLIASRLGINIFYWSKSSQALFLKNYSYIFLNETLTLQQQWQNFCHELAHILLHSGNQVHMTRSFREYQEAKANQFMFHACIPTFMLNNLGIKDYSTATVEIVSDLFQVEYDFALKRLTQYIQNKWFMQTLHGKQLQHL